MRKMLILTTLSLLLSGMALAEVIDFEQPYADGIIDPNDYYTNPVFLDVDHGIVGGMGNGDPGNWDLEGTAGSAFLGWNGPSNGGLQFDGPISNFSMDVSRSAGSSAGQTITVEFYAGAAMVGGTTVTLGEINTWSTIVFTDAAFDKVLWQGSENGFSPYGIDNIMYDPSGVSTESNTLDSVKALYR